MANMQNFDPLPAISQQWRARSRTQQTSSKLMDLKWLELSQSQRKGSLAETVVL